MPERESKRIVLDASKVREFDFQVAGHPGVLEVEGDGMIIKPLDQRELEFYECPGIPSELRSFMPLFYGTVEHARATSSGSPEKKKYLCLGNLIHGFKEPCVMDIKVGSRLYDIGVTAEKRRSRIEAANATTASTLGIFIMGMRVHGQPAADLQWCRDLTPTTMMDALDMYFAPAEQHVSAEYRRQVVEQFIKEISELKAVLEQCETRMYSGSLLLVYEASKERYEALVAKPDADNEDGSSDSDDDGVLINMRAIDFAHSHWIPGQGCDDLYLAGLSNLIKILGTTLQK
ncbi:hypothetical protein LPJ81_006184 [Coemansia sp. IMI 209127]|nr:hypothetical protein LPJ81_006184 [Coemansia sp. IMI 209127]